MLMLYSALQTFYTFLCLAMCQRRHDFGAELCGKKKQVGEGFILCS